MKPNSTFLDPLRRAAATASIVGLALLLSGCTIVAKYKISSAAMIQNPAEKKIPLNVGLMLDPVFCTNSYTFKNGMGDTFVFPFGAALERQSISICEQSFEKVAVSTNGVIPAGVDVTLTPKVYRCGFAAARRDQLFTLLLEWTLRTPDNRNIVWVNTVDGQNSTAAAEKKQAARARSSRVRATQGQDREFGQIGFQLLFDDLANKSYRAFRESPEIKRLTSKPSEATP